MLANPSIDGSEQDARPETHLHRQRLLGRSRLLVDCHSRRASFGPASVSRGAGDPVRDSVVRHPIAAETRALCDGAFRSRLAARHNGDRGVRPVSILGRIPSDHPAGACGRHSGLRVGQRELLQRELLRDLSRGNDPGRNRSGDLEPERVGVDGRSSPSRHDRPHGIEGSDRTACNRRNGARGDHGTVAERRPKRE